MKDRTIERDDCIPCHYPYSCTKCYISHVLYIINANIKEIFDKIKKGGGF